MYQKALFVLTYLFFSFVVGNVTEKGGGSSEFSAVFAYAETACFDSCDVSVCPPVTDAQAVSTDKCLIRYGRLPALLRNCPFLRNGGNVSPRNTCLLSGTPFRIISIHWAVCGFNARFHRNDRAGSVRYSYAYSSKLLNNT